MSIREETQRIEREILSPYAALSENTRGRVREAAECPIRTPYQRDRDKVIHCKAFRRLKHKTQVFLSPEGDHYRTRLTHTLEVAQIARTIARALRLNEDLTEAVALGHDLGHTPFGHAGERALNRLMPNGFRHYEQSVRVVERLENDGRGLNLTFEVRDGIRCHTTGQEARTMEGRIIRWADKIAYMNHDIDDAIRAGVIRESDIPRDITAVLGDTKNKRITTMVTSLIRNSPAGVVNMDADVLEAYDALHEFMYEAVYLNDYAKREEKKVPHLIESLFGYYVRHPDRLPESMREIAEADGKEQAACDYIAGMTDRFAVDLYSNLFIPKAWGTPV
ncbi:MAG TPA: deoxyguanosinetriphosphate triphosphohydrolase [Candidatus Ruminococcus gallistercoris]|nr:deoxyguanosinetriphosphate triphosphohydrolase [Candidatus Ruminococcus gallistercoris]